MAGARLNGKIALITGAASGLGAETARRMAREGARVFLTDINGDGGHAVCEAIAAAGGEAEFQTQNVTDEAQWDAIVAAAVARFGGLNVLVNNAGVSSGFADALNCPMEEWRRVLSINLDGVFMGARAAGRVMATSGGGSIINLSSILGKVGLAGGSAYCASKGGVALLTKSLALEWAALGIRVNSVHPGFIDTPMVSSAIQGAENSNEMAEMIVSRHALGRLGVPREIADAIVFLASDESSFMTGSELVVDGGYTAQ